MTRNLLLLRVYMRRYFLQWLAWRSFAFTLMANQAVTPLLGLAIWTTAVPGQQQLSTYYVSILFVKLITVSYEHHTFSTRIFSGDLQDDLVRPHSVLLQPLGENLSIRVWHVILAIPIFVILSAFVSIKISLSGLLFAIPAVLTACALQFLFTYSLALSGFWTGQASGVVGLGSTLMFLLGGEAVPIYLMPSGLQTILQTLPFSSMLAFPAEVLSGSLTKPQLTVGFGLQFIWLVIFAMLSKVIWQSGIRRYTSVGA